MVKILREGADLGGVRRQRGAEKSTPSWERSVSESVGGFSDWERLSQWDPPGGGRSFVGSAQASFREPSRRSESVGVEYTLVCAWGRAFARIRAGMT